MKRQLVVIAKDKETITLSSEDRCSSCSTKGVCGVGVLSKFMKKTLVTKSKGEEIGDLVEVEIENAQLLKAVFLLYLFPIIALFIGSIVANAFAVGLLWQVIISLIFFLLSIEIAKLLG